MADLILKTGQTRFSSNGRNTTAQFKVGGFTPGTTAYIALTGWSFQFTEPDHHIHEIGIWTQVAVPGNWSWANEFTVQPNGEVLGQFVVLFNDDSDDDPFTGLINYLVIGK